MHAIPALIGIALIAPLAGAGIGGVDIYDNRIDFGANTGAQMIETFESESLGDLALPTIFDSGLGVAMPVGDVSAYIDTAEFNQYGMSNTTIGGENFLAFGRNIPNPGGPTIPQTGSYSAEFTFGELVNAFGFDLSGAEFFSGAVGFNVTTFANGQIIDDFFWPSDQIFDVRFYGMVAEESFDTIRINIPVIGFDGTADYLAFDDVTWAVPAPSTAALLAVGGLMAGRRRR